MPDLPRVFEVLDPGALTTVQDLGRPGFAHLGVPRSGALDVAALTLANRLVGNPESAAGLETTATGARLLAHHPAVVAVTGAGCRVRVGGREVAWGAAVAVRAGAEVEIGPALTGLRSVLAVAGGVLTEPVLGSRSTDTLGGLGPPLLAAGHLLAFGAPLGPPSGVEAVPPARATELQLLPGPHADWFETDVLTALDGAVVEVGAASDRIGLRLGGAPLPSRSRSGELAPEGMVLGAVQAPPAGGLVALLADHATTGGYPVPVVLTARSIAACAQLRPGERVTLRRARRAA
jgi:biotin-dependent carboxylase-like uncharacterized protein